MTQGSAIRHILSPMLVLLALVSAAALGAPAPMERQRNCSATPTGDYVIRHAPSCASRLADGERRYGVAGRFLTLAESRQIPGSWLYAAPWGPCAEGQSLVFLTPGGAQLFAQTAGQCSERFAGGARAEPPSRPGIPLPEPPPVPERPGSIGGGVVGGGVGIGGGGTDSGMPSFIGKRSEFGCMTPPNAREYVRGLPGGRSCELRAGDELYCRQRDAYSRNPYLPTNPAWPMKPVGLRVTQDCRFLAGADTDGTTPGDRPAPSRSTANPERWTRPGQCCLGADGRAACPAGERTVLTGYARLDALRRLDSCPTHQIDPVVRGVELPAPTGDGRRWVEGLMVGAARCLQLSLATAQQLATHAQQWRFDLLERDLGLTAGEASGMAGGRRDLPVVQHRLLEITVQAMAADLMRSRLGAFSDDPRKPKLTDYESGEIAGEHLCGYGIAAAGQGLTEPLAGMTGKMLHQVQRRTADAGRKAADAARKGAAAASRAARAAAQKALRTIQAIRERMRRESRTTMTADETATVVQAIDDVTRPSADTLRGATLEGAIETHLLQTEAIRSGALAHTSVTLPGSKGPVTMRLGDYRGGGAFSAVYDVRNHTGGPSGRVVKILHDTRPYESSATTTPGLLNNRGGDSVSRQVRGSNLLQQAGVDTPAIHDWHAGTKPGEVSWIETDAVPNNSPGYDTWNGDRFSLADKERAVTEMHERIGMSGSIAVDTSRRNVYFYRGSGSGRVQAGVWDTDFVDRAGTRFDYANEGMRLGVLLGEIEKDASTAAAKGALFMDIDWGDAPQAMLRIRKINYGF